MIELRPLSHGLLALMHNSLVLGEGNAFYSPKALYDSLPNRISESYLRRALDELLKSEHAEYDSETDTITITNRGIRHVETQRKKDDSFIQQIQQDSKHYFIYQHGQSTAEDIDQVVESTIPAANRMVSRSDSQDEWRNVTAYCP